MRTKRTSVLLLTFFLAGAGFGQWNDFGGNAITSFEYLGASAGSTVPLRFTTIPNLRQEWRTNNTLRMRLNETLTGQVENGYAGLDFSGHLGIGSPVPTPALAMLHINLNGPVTTAYRPWMRAGAIITENTDWMYVGTKRENNDRIDAVINWGDNNEEDPTYGPDALRFIFTRNPTGANTCSAYDGLEIARVRAALSGNEGFFGIGDFFTASAVPDQRLDVLDGKVRIRKLPTDVVSSSTEMVMVNMANGILEHKPAAALPDNCEWTLGPGNNHVSTAYGPTTAGCPDENEAVGIGEDLYFYTSPPAKLVVRGGPSMGNGILVTGGGGSGGANYGVNVDVGRLPGGSYALQYGGVYAKATDATQYNAGGMFYGYQLTQNATRNSGVDALGEVDADMAAVGDNFGVYSNATVLGRRQW